MLFMFSSPSSCVAFGLVCMLQDSILGELNLTPAAGRSAHDSVLREVHLTHTPLSPYYLPAACTWTPLLRVLRDTTKMFYMYYRGFECIV